MSTQSAKEMTTNYTEVDVSRLSFTKLEQNTRSKGQTISYPRYNHPVQGADSPLFIQFPWITLNTYGIPRTGEYYPTDDKRSFIKIPLDQSIPEIKQFSDLLRSIDEKFGSEENKIKLFGATEAPKYVYQPIYRQPDEPNRVSKGKDGSETTVVNYPYMKLKLDTTYPDNHVKSIVYNSIMKDGKRIRTKIEDIKTIDDLASHVCFLSKIRPIGRPVKLWAQTKPIKKNAPMDYGIAFKMVKTEVEPPSKNNSQVKKYMDSDAFLDSDEESDTVEKVQISKSVSQTAPKVDQESDDETPAPKLTKKLVAQVDSDNESDDDAPAPVSTSKTTKKPVAQVVSDDESDGDEPVLTKTAPVSTPATTSKSTSKAPVKQAVAEESDEDDFKPVTKTVKGKTTATPVKSKKSTA
jgi:hypothetical protein